MEYVLAVFFGTFILEDIAIAVALGLIADNKLNILPAFAACFAGIALGDIALYLAGWTVQRLRPKKPFRFVQRIRASVAFRAEPDFFTYPIIISRFIPGTRLPTYILAGLIRFPFLYFCVLTVLTVFAWVGLTFAFGQSLHSVFSHHWIISILISLLFLKLIKWLV
ncbi:MAG: DedA family protein, partial [Pseudobdellovibrionaceae bacterium]